MRRRSVRLPVIRNAFKALYPHPNLMTPDIVEYGHVGRFAYELTRGEFMGHEMHGVTVIELSEAGTPPIKRNDLTVGGQWSEAEARAYIASEFTARPSWAVDHV